MPLPNAAAEAVKAKIKQQQDAVRANGIRQGRALERQDICAQLGASTIEDLSVLNRVTQELDQRWQREERKEAKGAFWRGLAFGLAGGAMLTSGGFLLLVDRAMQSAFDRATEFGERQVMTGAAVAAQAQRDAEPNYPRSDEPRSRREPESAP